MATIPGSNDDLQIDMANYNPMTILKWLICHTQLCDEVTTSTKDIRQIFVEQNPYYAQFKLTRKIGQLLNMVYYGNLQKTRKHNGTLYNVQVFEDAIMDIEITIKGGGGKWHIITFAQVRARQKTHTTCSRTQPTPTNGIMNWYAWPKMLFIG